MPIHLFHVGTQKAGSTFLYNLLASHPEISLSKYTEVNYFSLKQKLGETWYENSFGEGNYRIDTSPKYFMKGLKVAPNIKNYCKKHKIEPRFLLILRNPIDYLYSHFRMHLNQDFFKKHPGIFGVPKNNDIIEFTKKSSQYLERAQYFKILNNYWLPYFKLEQFKIIFFEDFVTKREEIIAEILNFWGIPLQKLQAKTTSKNQMLRYKPLAKIQNLVVKNHKIKNLLKKSKLFNTLYDNFLTSSSSNQLSTEERIILKRYFEKDFSQLEKLLNKKITSWKDF